jgi:hypothetical protein
MLKPAGNVSETLVPLTGKVPSVVVPSMNVIVPAAVPAPSAAAVTQAVKTAD